MSADAISAVTRGLRAFLLSQLSTGRKVTLLPPGDDPPSGGSGINLYLYRVAESPYLRNEPWPGDRSGRPPLPQPALSLALHYLLTPFGPTPSQDDPTDEAQRALGEAMLALHLHPVLTEVHVPGFDSSTVLAASLLNGIERVTARLQPTGVEELARIWGTIGKPYRLSVAYEMEIVQLVPQQAAPVSAPSVQQVGLSVRPFAGPRITALVPETTPLATVNAAGDVAPAPLTIQGTGLLAPGTPTAVTVAGVSAAVTAASPTAVTVTLPAALPTGPVVPVVLSAGGLSATSELTVAPWLAGLKPVRTALAPSEGTLALTGPGLGTTTRVRATGAVAWSTTDVTAVGPAVVTVPAPPAATSNSAPGGGLPNGEFTVSAQLGDGRVTNRRTLQVLPRVDAPDAPNGSSYDGTTSTLTLRGARLDGTDVVLRVDTALFRLPANAVPDRVAHVLGRPLTPGTHTVAIAVDGLQSREITVVAT